MKALGAEINDFWNNHFPADCWSDGISDDMDMFDDVGNFALEANEEYDLALFGVVVSGSNGKTESFGQAFLRWQRDRLVAVFAVAAPRQQAEAIKEAIKKMGCEVAGLARRVGSPWAQRLREEERKSSDTVLLNWLEEHAVTVSDPESGKLVLFRAPGASPLRQYIREVVEALDGE